MDTQLRNFVYLDDSTLNDHLSSLGQGIPQEVVQQSGGETETSGNAKIGIPNIGLGAGGERTRLNLDSAETTLRILAPDRFQQLEELVADNGETLYSNPSEVPPRGSTIEITGEVSPMGLFKFEAALRSMLELVGDELQQALDEQDDVENITDEDIQGMEQIEVMVSQLAGDKIPLEIVVDEKSYVTPLSREFMRVSPFSEFAENREYTVFGRVESTIDDDEQWDPTLATSVLDRYVPQENAGEDLRSRVRTMSRQMDMEIGGDNLIANGPGCVIHPIGMYW